MIKVERYTPSTMAARIKNETKLKNIQKRNAAETRLNECVKNVAKTVYKDSFFYTVHVTEPAEKHVSISEQILRNRGALDMSDSVWAPWSINGRA